MKELNELILLYDYYKDLLTEVQRNYFEKYYFDNLSLAEIEVNMILVEMPFISK